MGSEIRYTTRLFISGRFSAGFCNRKRLSTGPQRQEMQDQAMRTHYCGDINETLIDQTVTFCGWVHRRRDHGGVIFLDVRDREGLVQVVFDPDTVDAFNTADSVRSEFVVQISGRVRGRPEGTTNPNMKTGLIEVLGKEITILNKAATPPFRQADQTHTRSRPAVCAKERYA